MDLRRRLVDLSLPPPLETWIQRAVGPFSVDRKHEELIVAWEATSKVVAAAMWAVCRQIGLRSADLERQLHALARPSFGHWIGLIRACRTLLDRHEQNEVQGLAPLLAGLRAGYTGDRDFARLAERIALATEGKLPGGHTVFDLLQALPAYRNAAQSTHHHEAHPCFREASLEPLLEGLLALCKVAPPLGIFEVAVVHRLERDEGGHEVELAVLQGSFVTMERCPLPEETWSGLQRGRPYLFARPDHFVSLFPMAAAEPFEGSWRIGWLAGRVHAPTLAYQGSERGRFQIAVEPEEYEGLLGGFEAEARVPDEVLAMEPYRGLLAYEEEHAPLFFGREEEVEQALSRLDTARVLVVCGASGAGKSSFMKAGIVPALRKRVEDQERKLLVVSLTPGIDPLASLARALRMAGPRDVEGTARWSKLVGELLPEDPGRIARDALAHLLRGLAAEGHAVTLCVDQLEEVATLAGRGAGALRFLDLLVDAARADEGPVRVVATVRADLVGHLLEHEGFRALLDAHALHLGGIGPSRLERVITEPLRGRRVGIEPGLPEAIVADVAERPGAVALLSQVLTTLWEERAAHGDWLTKQGYEDAGRVAGALRTQADAAREELILATEDAATFDSVLCELAHHDADHGFARRRVALGLLAEAVELEVDRLRELLGPLVRRRLLVLSKTGDGDRAETVEVAHEALLSSWPYLAELLRTKQEAIALRQEVEAAAAAWEQSNRRRELWSDATSKLSRAEEMYAAGLLALPSRERAFLKASRASVTRRRRLERTVAASLAMLCVLAGYLFLQAETNAALAERRAGEIGQQRNEIQKRKSEFDQLAGVVRLEEARAAEEGLVPARPGRVEAMERWKREHGEPVLAMVEPLTKALRELEGRALSRTAEPEDGSDVSQIWIFEDEAQGFLHRTLSGLLADINAFEENEVKSVDERLAWARRIVDITLSHPTARFTWEDARDAVAKADDAVASSLYAEHPIDLSPQLGLIPLGKNPATGLWEFYHLRSAADWRRALDGLGVRVPPRLADGSFRVTEETGLVFVLVPGGRGVVGADGRPGDRTSDAPYPNEAPAEACTVAPFLLSRYEMTQAQWMRLAGGENPSHWRPRTGPCTLTHPVESVTWYDASNVLGIEDLRLPTEIEWEYSCRAGTGFRWWTGDDRESLRLPRAVINIADEAAERSGLRLTDSRDWPGYDDGRPLHAPVGAYPANPFGLHEVLGNVWEWCSDSYSDRRGVAPAQDLMRVVRGGSWYNRAGDARCSRRKGLSPSDRFDNVGLRAAMTLRVWPR